MGTRLARGVPLGQAIHTPVTGVLCGRRNNPVSVDGKVPALACHNPLHYYELPELFMEITPSTTGAGSEGALTKVDLCSNIRNIL
jgi:phosphoenolpyruvate carboxykinase (diphosphate)